MVETIEQIVSNMALFQIVFYVVSPIATILAVWTAYYAIYRQSKPSIVVYFDISETASFIDLVICNHGSGSAWDIEFSVPIPTHCWGIESPVKVDPKEFLNPKIPALVAGKELRYHAGQYAGIFSQIGDAFTVTAKYKYRTPLRNSKKSEDTSILDIRYMKGMKYTNSAAQDLSDAMKGRNNTIFSQLNKSLKSIEVKLGLIASSLQDKEDSD